MSADRVGGRRCTWARLWGNWVGDGRTFTSMHENAHSFSCSMYIGQSALPSSSVELAPWQMSTHSYRFSVRVSSQNQ